MASGVKAPAAIKGCINGGQESGILLSSPPLANLGILALLSNFLLPLRSRGDSVSLGEAAGEAADLAAIEVKLRPA